MPVVIGIDEAGYAPNLGPFVIGGSLWQVESTGGEALAKLVDKVSRALDGACADDAEIRPFRFADSKKVFDRAEGPASLEPDVLALLACCCALPLNAKSLFASAASVPEDFLDQLPGYSWQDMKVPSSASLEEIVCRSRALATGLESAGVRPLGLAASSLYPRQWNDGVDQYGNKATLLGMRSLALIRELLDVAKRKCPDEKQISICCDKHGGRNHYAAMLQEELAEGFVRVVAESRETSVYVWRDDEAREFQITFSARGDSEGPVAVASMLAKYLRELAMAAWNAYWIREVPGLLPTAGYPVDAKRFRRDIGHVLRKMSIPEEAIWRHR